MRVNMRHRVLGVGSGIAGSGSPRIPDVEELRSVETTTGECKVRRHLEREDICYRGSWVCHLLCIPNHQRKWQRSHRLAVINDLPQSVVNLIGPARSSDSTSTSSDMITQLLVHGVSLFPSINLSTDQVASVARQVSLVLIGAIILSSLRQLMSGIKRACIIPCISGTRADIHKNSVLGAQGYQQEPRYIHDVAVVGSDHGEADLFPSC